MNGVANGCLICVLLAPSIALAQSADNAQSATDQAQVRFLSAYRARMGASRLDRNDRAYSWDARISADIDLLDYGRGRVNFFGEYEVILGSQLRTFDPNQSLYTLDFRATRRAGRNEIAGLYHHVSRHLSDRAKTNAIDWNAIGTEFVRADTVKSIRTESLVRGDWVVKRTTVDYAWQVRGRVRLERPTSHHVVLIGETSLDVVGTDRDIAARGTQIGAYFEGGARLPGSAGALDFILAIERRVDADPLRRGPKSWALVGFRLMGP